MKIWSPLFNEQRINKMQTTHQIGIHNETQRQVTKGLEQKLMSNKVIERPKCRENESAHDPKHASIVGVRA